MDILGESNTGLPVFLVIVLLQGCHPFRKNRRENAYICTFSKFASKCDERYAFFHRKLILCRMRENEQVDVSEWERRSNHENLPPDAREMTDMLLYMFQ